MQRGRQYVAPHLRRSIRGGNRDEIFQKRTITAPYSGSGSGRPAGSRARQSQKKRIQVIITGYPKDTKFGQIIKFLREKCPVELQYQDNKFSNQSLELTFTNQAQVTELIKLNRINFRGNKLFIQQRADLNSPMAKAIIQYVTTHYDRQAKFLDLSNLAGQPELQKYADFSRRAFLLPLLKILQIHCKDALTISFASNRIRSLQPFAALHTCTPGVKNLSFEDNSIPNVKQLDYLKALKLDELIFTRNPLEDHTSNEELRTEIMTRFPRLKHYNQAPIAPTIQFDVGEEADLPAMQVQSCDSAEQLEAIKLFVQRYITAFDTNRQDLLPAYAEQAVFSMTTDDRLLPDSAPLRSHSRNLTRLTGIQDRIRLMHYSRLRVKDALVRIPPTKHLMDAVRLDCHQFPGMLCVSLVGTFLERNSILRQFSRTMILTPVAPNSEVARLGWQAQILNDQLHIATASGRMRQNQRQGLAQTDSASDGAPPPAAQERLIGQLSERTRLTPQMAYECLYNNQWNLDAAWSHFIKLKDSGAIPPDAFIS